jgi:creatinine deaminase
MDEPHLTPAAMLEVAVAQARAGTAEGGVPVGAALFGPDGTLLGEGRNRRVQDGDPSVHGETAAFRAACWYCAGLVRQFGIGRLVVGEARSFVGQHDWLAEHGVEVVLLDDPECFDLMSKFIAARPDIWNEDIGVD